MKKKRLTDLLAVAMQEAIWAQGRLEPEECEEERNKLFELKTVLRKLINQTDQKVVDELTRRLDYLL